jgi:choline dehydrogenase
MEQTIHRAPLVDRQRLSAAGAEAQNVSLVNGFARRVTIENQRATGVEIEAHGKIQVVQGKTRGHPRRLVDQLAEAPDAVGHRPGEHLKAKRHRGGRRPAGRRPEPAGPSGTLHPAGIDQADHAELGAQPLLQGADRRASGCSSRRGSARPTISRPPPSCARSAGVDYPDIQYHFMPAACAMTARRRRSRTASRRMSGRCARSRAARSRCARPIREDEAGDPLQLHVASRRLVGLPPLHPADPRDLRPAAFDPIRGKEISPGKRTCRATRTGRLHPRACRERLSSLRHLPHGPRRRPDGGGRSGMPGHRRRGPARGGFLDLPARHQRQPQRAVDHDRREGVRPHPRPAAAAPSNQEPWINPRWRESDR